MSNQSWEHGWRLAEGTKGSEGGQGTVRMVQRLSDGKIGALKQLHSSLLRITERRQRMAREVLALAQVQGEGVPRVLDHNMDFVNDPEVPLYFVAEWAEGQTLQQYVDRGLPSIEAALEITRSLALILSRCHAAGVYHRDIKPDNIMISPANRQVTLVDFGTAWANPGSESSEEFHTELGQELGNRFLRIPDLAAGRERRDPRADITLLVGVLFFLLTGKTPRVLIDQQSRPPHIALESYFSEASTSTEQWHLVRRIFDVGFQPSVDLRFQTATILTQYLDEALNPTERTRQPSDYEAEIAAFQELINTTISNTWDQLERTMLRISNDLRVRLDAMARRDRLFSASFGGPSIIQPRRSVELVFVLSRAGVHVPQAQVHHLIELVGPGRSDIQMSYRSEHGLAMIYYEGPSADMDRLEEELIERAEPIFLSAVRVLRQKLMEANGD